MSGVGTTKTEINMLPTRASPPIRPWIDSFIEGSPLLETIILFFQVFISFGLVLSGGMARQAVSHPSEAMRAGAFL